MNCVISKHILTISDNHGVKETIEAKEISDIYEGDKYFPNARKLKSFTFTIIVKNKLEKYFLAANNKEELNLWITEILHAKNMFSFSTNFFSIPKGYKKVCSQIKSAASPIIRLDNNLSQSDPIIRDRKQRAKGFNSLCKTVSSKFRKNNAFLTLKNGQINDEDRMKGITDSFASTLPSPKKRSSSELSEKGRKDSVSIRKNLSDFDVTEIEQSFVTDVSEFFNLSDNEDDNLDLDDVDLEKLYLEENNIINISEDEDPGSLLSNLSENSVDDLILSDDHLTSSDNEYIDDDNDNNYYQLFVQTQEEEITSISFENGKGNEYRLSKSSWYDVNLI